MVKRQFATIRKLQTAALPSINGGDRPLDQADVRLRQLAPQQPFGCGTVAGQELGGHETDFDRLSQRPPSRQGKLDAAGAASDKNHSVRGANFLFHGLPCRQETTDGLDRNPHLRRRVGHGPAIDGQQVKPQRRTAFAMDSIAIKVQGRRCIIDEPSAGEPAKRAEIYVQVLPAMPAGHISRQHARIGAVRLPRQNGQPHTIQGRHAERLEHLHMAVAAADQQQVANWRRRGTHQRPPPRLRFPRPCCGVVAMQSGA